MIHCFLTILLLSVPVPTGSAMQGNSELDEYHQQVRHTVAEILSEPEFTYSETRSWWESFSGWFNDLFESVSSGLACLPSGILWFIVVFLVLTVLAIIVHTVYMLYCITAGGRGRSTSGQGGDSRSHVLGIVDLTFESVYENARKFAENGEWLEAIKYYYVAAILALDRQGRLAFDRSKTNYDYLRELPFDFPRRNEFRHLTTSFEAVVYGGDEATSSLCRELAGEADLFCSEVIGNESR